MNDGDKIAAAILAAGSAFHAMEAAHTPKALLHLYEHYLDELARKNERDAVKARGRST